MTPSQTFHDHVGELRRRIAWIVLTIGLGSAVGYMLRTRVINLIQHPLGAPLFYTSPAGSFNFVLKTASIIGFMLALPLVIYHLIRFIEPALPNPIKKSLIIQTVLFSTVLAVMGVGFAFYIMVPMSLHFFATFSSATIKPLISADEYLTYVLNLLLTFGVLFQIPLIMLFINRVKPLQPRKILKYQRYVVVGAFVLAVILPFTYDPISQFIMAVPIIFLFYFSVMLIWWANRHVTYEAEIVKEELVTEAPPQSAWVQPREPQAPTLAQPARVAPRATYRHSVPASLAPLDLRASSPEPTQAINFQPPPGMRVNRLNVLDLSDQT